MKNKGAKMKSKTLDKITLIAVPCKGKFGCHGCFFFDKTSGCGCATHNKNCMASVRKDHRNIFWKEVRHV